MVLYVLVAYADLYILNTCGSEELKEGFSGKARLIQDSFKQIISFKVE